jgi:hypothetical protein
MVSLAAHDHSGSHSQIPTNGIENLAVTAAKIANGTITGTQIASSAISEAKIANLAVTNSKLATNAVSSSKIANGAVGTNQIADDAVDYYKHGPNSVYPEHVGPQVPAIVRRFGGSSTDWELEGSGSYDPSNVRIQFGVFECAYLGQVDVAFSPAFASRPWIMFSVEDSVEIDSQVSFPVGEGFDSHFRFTHFTSGVTAKVFWLAIGPE